MKSLNRINGMQKLIQDLPEEYRYWHLFGNILELEYKKTFDYEEWLDVYNVNLLVTDDMEQYCINILLKNVSGEISFGIANRISGFSIKDMKMDGYENNSRFHIYDFENGDFSIYCEDIVVKMLNE